jgi:hypothetical protein
VFPGADVDAGGVGIDQLPALAEVDFLLLLFRFWGFAFHVLLVASAQEWHEELQSLKQDNSAGSAEPAELH